MKFKFIMCIMWITLVALLLNSVYAASATSTPSLVTKITNAFSKIQGYLKKIATPVAGVCLISGVLVRKLSFGDEQKMILGRTIIVNTIVGYAIIQLSDLIIKFIEAVVK